MLQEAQEHTSMAQAQWGQALALALGAICKPFTGSWGGIQGCASAIVFVTRASMVERVWSTRTWWRWWHLVVLQGALENHWSHSLELPSTPLPQHKALNTCLRTSSHKKILACSSLEQKGYQPLSYQPIHTQALTPLSPKWWAEKSLAFAADAKTICE